MMPSLSNITSFLFDMDGVLYRSNHRLPGAKEFIELLQAQGVPFALLTNNSTLTRAQYVAKLAAMDIHVPKERIVTSAQATAEYLARIGPPGARVFVVGEEGIRNALMQRGFTLVEKGEAEYVVVGMDTKLTYDKLKRAALAIRAGATFIGTNPDRTFPAPEGLYPGTGSLLALLETATDVKPQVIGKPQPAIFELALQQTGLPRSGTAVVGDQLETDIRGGKAAGLATILVMTGTSSPAELERSNLKPDWVFPNLGALMMAWKET